MEKKYIDFRKDGFLIKRIFLFAETTYILLDDVPKKSDQNYYDLKFDLIKGLNIEARTGFLDYDYLKIKSIFVEKNIFINYMEYTLFVSAFETNEVFNLNSLIYNSMAMNQCLMTIQSVSRTTDNVLIFGDTGTGKEFLAKLIHFNSTQKNNPFYVFNCALFKNEKDLLGSEKGSFTSSFESTKGVFSLINRGVLVLDGPENMSLKAQSVFLRIMEDKMLKRIGSDSFHKSNFRIISIFNKNPLKLIEEGALRIDLFYRLSTHIVEVPSLNSRLEDLEPLISFFTKGYKISFRAIEILKNHNWSGNVRELINVLNRAKISSFKGCIDASNLSFNEISEDTENKYRTGLLKNVETALISKVLKYCSSNVLRASKILGLTRVTLIKKIKDLT